MLAFALVFTAAAVKAGRAPTRSTPNTTPPAVQWQPNYEHLGAWVGASLESSPLFFKGELYLMASQMGLFPRDGSNGSHSYFCVMNGRTGEEVSCPATSSGHAFCSSIVDTVGPMERVWVFCSAWDRANQTSCTDPLWGCGACGLSRSNESDCYIGAWSSEDLHSWTFAPIITLPRPLTVPNVAVSMVPPHSRDRPLPSGLPRHQAWMALDSPAPPIAVNVGSEGDLHANWEILDRQYTDANNNNNRWGGMGIECMAVRYNPMDDYYYALGGGEEIVLTRSRNLSVGSWERGPATAPRGHLKGRGILMATGCYYGNESCAPTADMSRIADGYYTNYWKNQSDHSDRVFLKNLTRWNWSVNDADFCDENGSGPTRFIYGMSCQTRPAAIASEGACGNFYSLGIYQGNESQWLSSYFHAPELKTVVESGTVIRGSLPRLEVSFGKVDGLPSPLGARSRPRFSWVLQSTTRNVTQSSYRLVVSQTETGAVSGTEVVCDTGKVVSAKSTLVECGTSPLDAGKVYWWSVSVRAVDGSKSDWLVPQSFSVGLQSREDWSPAAKFIGLKDTDRNACPWFRKTFVLDDDDLGAITNGTASALLHVASVGFHEPYINGIRLENNSILMPSVSDMGRRVLSRIYNLQHFLNAGNNTLGLWLAPGWASLNWPDAANGAAMRPPVGFNISKAPLVMAELRFQLNVNTGLLKDSIVTNNAWRARRSNIAHNDHSGNGPSYTSGWRWANYYGEDIDHTRDESGWSTVSLDDTNWTAAMEYSFERLVTPEILESVGVVETVPAVKIELCSQNASQSVCSANSSLLGGVQEECESFVGGCGPSNLLNLTCASGVISKIEFASFGVPTGTCGSFEPGSCNSSVSYRVVADACLGKKSCSIMPNMSNFGGDPCRGQKKKLAIQASGCVPTPPRAADASCYVITMQKLFAGWLQVADFPAPSGANVTLQYSSTAGVSEEWTAHDSVVLSTGRHGSSFSNRFNWHEFQFVTMKSSQLTGPPDISKITGLRIRNARPRVGWFESSDAMLNKVYDAHVETIEGLQQSGMLVDCPNRERFGYGGDSNSHIEFVMYTYASSPLFDKWTRDWADVSGRAPQDTQPAAGLPDGNVPNSAPTFDGDGGPAWGAICVLMPYRHYLVTGDISGLRSAYPTMRGYLTFLLRHAGNGTGLLTPSGFDFLGDWQSPHGNGGGDDTLLFNNAHFVYVLRLGTEVATAVGAAHDAMVYSAAATAIGNATHSQFFNATTSKYLEGKQTQQLTPLISGMVPDEAYNGVVEALLDEIVVRHNGHLDTGTFGTYFLQNFLSAPAVLSDTNTPGSAGPRRDDLLLQVATVTTYPGYGWHIDQGCTTWPETWDCQPVAGGTSRMHSTHNGFGLWFYQGLLGIRPDPAAPGFGAFTLRPAYKSGLAWARGAVHTPHGPVNISWSVAGTDVALNISVPVSSKAQVWLPAARPGDVLEGSSPAIHAAGFIRQDGNDTVWNIGSGSYSFTTRAPRDAAY